MGNSESTKIIIKTKSQSTGETMHKFKGHFNHVQMQFFKNQHLAVNIDSVHTHTHTHTKQGSIYACPFFAKWN